MSGKLDPIELYQVRNILENIASDAITNHGANQLYGHQIERIASQLETAAADLRHWGGIPDCDHYRP